MASFDASEAQAEQVGRVASLESNMGGVMAELHPEQHVVCGCIHDCHLQLHHTRVVSTSAQVELQLAFCDPPLDAPLLHWL